MGSSTALSYYLCLPYHRIRYSDWAVSRQEDGLLAHRAEGAGGKKEGVDAVGMEDVAACQFTDLCGVVKVV